jgi:hypothetical protein
MAIDPVDGMDRCNWCDGYIWQGRCADRMCPEGPPHPARLECQTETLARIKNSDGDQ